MKNKIFAAIVVVALGFGTWFGHSFWKPAVDPQNYFETVFTPDDSGSKVYLDWLDKHARHSLFVADYTFTNDSVADKYVELRTKYHSDVHVLLDLGQSRAVKWEPGLIEKLRSAGIDVVIGTSPKAHAIMHNKYSIGDGAWVEDGSWNYTFTADKQENTLNMNIVPSPLRAAKFKGNWDEMHAFMKQQQDRRPPAS